MTNLGNRKTLWKDFLFLFYLIASIWRRRSEKSNIKEKGDFWQKEIRPERERERERERDQEEKERKNK